MIENLNDVNVLNYLQNDIVNTNYSNTLIKKAIKLLEDNNKTYFIKPEDLGISRFPSDFRLYRYLNEWAEVVYEDNQKFSDNNWNVENIVLGVLQDYCQLFDFYVDRDSVKSALDQILKVFPKNVVFLNYLSYYYSSAKEYEKSIEVLLSAYKIDPDDYIIIGNLASDYEKMENYKEAEKWYTIMSKINSDNAKAYASEGLERVRNKK